MKWLLALWHSILADWDDQELRDRSRDGSASDVWAVRVREQINWRRKRIEQLTT